MRLLLVGDFVKHSGFARVNEALAAELTQRGWDIAVLGVNYQGDPHPLQQSYRIYPAMLGGDMHGVGRIADVARVEESDAILLVCDPWIARLYLAALIGATHPPVTLYTPIDGTGMRPRDIRPLNACAHVVAYTQFGADELRRAGYAGPLSIIPHGIDLARFRPIPQAEARQQAGMPQDWFVVLVFDQNQPRKRLDIAFDAFARFAEGKPDTVRLVYHGPLQAESGWDIVAMAADLGIADRFTPSARGIRGLSGVPIESLPLIYAMCDVKLSTTAGEGWGLTTMEAMACGLPCIAPDFAALGEWAKGAALMVDAPIATRHCGGINTVGHVPEAWDVVTALEHAYARSAWRAQARTKGLTLVQEERFQWGAIAAQFDQVLRQAGALDGGGEAGQLASSQAPVLREVTA